MTISNLIKSQSAPRIERLPLRGGTWFALYGTLPSGNHYAKQAIQPWDVMGAWMTPLEFAAYLRGNCIKYLARYQDKNGVEDLRKCQHYLAKLIEVEESFTPKTG